MLIGTATYAAYEAYEWSSSILFEDGSIGRIDLWWADFLRVSEEKYMTLHISMVNKGADKGYVSAFEDGHDAAGGKKLEKIVPLNSLDTQIVVYKSDSHENKISMAFVYDGVWYQFGGYDFTESEMLSVIEQMK